MFDVGQKVICVRKEPWPDGPVDGVGGPGFGAECVVLLVVREGQQFIHLELRVRCTSLEDAIEVQGWEGIAFAAKWFRPKEPDIEALRGLLTDVPDEKAAELITEILNDSASGAKIGDGTQRFSRLSRATSVLRQRYAGKRGLG